MPRDFIEQLVAKGLFPDAVRVIAHALPRREAVWWAWVCARKDSGAEPAPPIQAALDATERWIVQPTDENRREALLYRRSRRIRNAGRMRGACRVHEQRKPRAAGAAAGSARRVPHGQSRCREA